LKCLTPHADSVNLDARHWTTNGNVFQGNTYRVASGSDENWALGSPEDWPSWQAIGFDTEGEIISP